jgi:hypothetical protein
VELRVGQQCDEGSVDGAALITAEKEPVLSPHCFPAQGVLAVRGNEDAATVLEVLVVTMTTDE